MKRTLAIVTSMVVSAHPCLSSQIGATKDELALRYGPCSHNPGPNPTGQSVDDSVIDVGDMCGYQHDHFRITAYFKAGKAVAIHYRKLDSLSYRKRPHYIEMTDEEIASLLRSAVEGAQWVPSVPDKRVRRWRTMDSSALAYYYPYNHNEEYALIVQTAAVDEIYRRVSPE